MLSYYKYLYVNYSLSWSIVISCCALRWSRITVVCGKHLVFDTSNGAISAANLSILH